MANRTYKRKICNTKISSNSNKLMSNKKQRCTRIHNKTKRRLNKKSVYVKGGWGIGDLILGVQKTLDTKERTKYIDKQSRQIKTKYEFEAWKNGMKTGLSFDPLNVCVVRFDGYFKKNGMDTINKVGGMKPILMTYLVYKHVLKAFIIRNTDKNFQYYMDMINVMKDSYNQNLFRIIPFKTGNIIVHNNSVDYPQKGGEIVVTYDEQFNKTSSSLQQILNKPDFDRKYYDDDGTPIYKYDNYIQGIPCFGEITNTTIGYDYKIYLNYKPVDASIPEYGDNIPIISFTCVLPKNNSATDDEIIIESNLFYQKVQHILNKYYLVKEFFNDKENTPKVDVLIKDAAVVMNYAMSIDKIIAILSSIVKDKSTCSVEDEDVDNSIKLNKLYTEAINHIISAKFLYNKEGTNQYNSYPDYSTTNRTVGYYTPGTPPPNNEDTNPYNNYEIKKTKIFESLGRRENKFRLENDKSVEFQKKFNYNKKSNLSILIVFLQEIKNKLNHTEEYYERFLKSIEDINRSGDIPGKLNKTDNPKNDDKTSNIPQQNPMGMMKRNPMGMMKRNPMGMMKQNSMGMMKQNSMGMMKQNSMGVTQENPINMIKQNSMGVTNLPAAAG